MTIGPANVGLSFAGLSSQGNLKTNLGAWAKVDGFVDIDLGLLGKIKEEGTIWSVDYALNINKAFTPKIDDTVTGSDSFTAAKVGVDF